MHTNVLHFCFVSRHRKYQVISFGLCSGTFWALRAFLKLCSNLLLIGRMKVECAGGPGVSSMISIPGAQWNYPHHIRDAQGGEGLEM